MAKIEEKQVQAPDKAPAKSEGKVKNASELDAFKQMEKPAPGKLVSRLDHTATVAYDGDGLQVPPRAHGKTAVNLANWKLLGALPAGVQLIKG